MLSVENKMIGRFPPGFLWGAAISSQAHGYPRASDWYEWERKPGRIKDGSLSRPVCDLFDQNEKVPSCISLAKNIKLNAFRFCIEWADIEPEQNQWDEGALQNYANAVDACCAANMTPFPWLWHFVLPKWIALDGGWANPETIERFVRYAERVLAVLGAKITYIGTYNEPSGVLHMGFVKGLWPPEEKNDWYGLRQAKKHLVVAHRRTCTLIKKRFPHIKVGMALNISFDESYRSWHPGDRFITWLNHKSGYSDSRFLERVHGDLDWIGLNYYCHNRYKFVMQRSKNFFERENENKVVSDLGWEVCPQGIKAVVKELGRFRKPIYITENGVADALDALRPEFLKGHLRYLNETIAEGADVRGYFHWSLVDNAELHEGLIDFGLHDRKGNPRPSAELYRKIIELQQ